MPIVVRSYQILPGVGGIYPEDLIQCFGHRTKKHQSPLFIATACRMSWRGKCPSETGYTAGEKNNRIRLLSINYHIRRS
jgi:hypothetical protein